jgi:hypothetical protein
MTSDLRTHLTRLIAYAESADTSLQQEVAEKLANEAVKPARQQQIVEVGGLKLLLPLTESRDMEVRRLAAHALANLSVNADNQVTMADQGGIEMLVTLVETAGEGPAIDAVHRQASKVSTGEEKALNSALEALKTCALR